MRGLKFSLLFVMVFSLLPAQIINLNWEGTKEYNYSNQKSINIPFFTSNLGEYAVNSEGIPVLGFQEETTQASEILLKNINYTLVSEHELIHLNKEAIPSELEFDARVVRGAGKYYLIVSLLPFVKKDNQIQKVTSFQITREQSKSGRNIEGRKIWDDARNSALASGDWYKISVDKSGIFKLDKSFFQKNGIPANFDPRTLRIYGNGGARLLDNPAQFRYGALQENAIQFVGEEDGIFDAADYVLFYAQGPHSWNKENAKATDITHRFNIYSDKAYYFINIGSVRGKRINEEKIDGAPSAIFDEFDNYQFYEKDNININNLGRRWLGENFTLHPSQTFTFETASRVESKPISISYVLVGKSAVNNTYSLSLNGEEIQNGRFGSTDFYPITERGLLKLSDKQKLDINITVNNAANPGGNVFLDYITLRYAQKLNYEGGQLAFRRLERLNDGKVYGFRLQKTTEQTKVWNVSDLTNATRLNTETNVYKYQSSSPYFQNEFIAFTDVTTYTDVKYAGKVQNQNTRNLTAIDYAIVCHPAFLSEARRLANFRERQNKVKVAVVTTEQIYNDFSSGAQDINAIRDFFKHLYDNGSPLKYVLLFGGGSYDFKDRIENNTNFVPTYQSFNSASLESSFAPDDFFTMLDDGDEITDSYGEGEYRGAIIAQMDVAIGRMPAHTVTEAKTMVDKVISYYTLNAGKGSAFGDWKTRVHLVVDDDYESSLSDSFHDIVEKGVLIDKNKEAREESVVEYLTKNYPYLTLRKLYTDSFIAENTSGGQRYPQVSEAISNAFDLGTSFILYFGHGGPRGWMQERVVSEEGIAALTNFNSSYARSAVVMTITCDFTIWDIPDINSVGEVMLKNSKGGAVAMLTTSRAIGTDYGQKFNKVLLETVFKDEGEQFLPLGEALRLAKVNYNKGGFNNYMVSYLGDPMLGLVKPPRKIELQKINNEEAIHFDGVLKALDFVELEGVVLNEAQNAKDNSFSGEITTALFDKPIKKKTLNNDGVSGRTNLNYEEQVNPIYRGTTKVENGSFKIQFYVPKDINYEIGKGKLVIYAHNNKTDAVTVKDDIKIGGLNPDGIKDDRGPLVNLYMNNLNFANGGITDRGPHFVACVVDSTGINTTGTGIGHDIIATLDGDLESTYVLNEYFEGGDNNPCVNKSYLDYQKGQVVYKLNNLKLGEHSIRFKVWDINNNSTTETLDFVVLENGESKLYIDKLLNWPNPFTASTYFHFEHNCAAELEVLVQIFTVSGKMVKTIRQTISSEPFREGYRTGRFAIPWEGLDDFGDKIGKGVYIYRLTARGVESELCKGTATAIEKLVILK